MKTVITTRPEETAALAEELAKTMKGGEVIALYGDLGAGKTTFAQAFAKALGVRERVQSPTFILMHEHRLKKEGGPAVFLHADAYRGDATQFRGVGFDEYLGRPDAVTLVEWAERVEELLPDDAVRIRFRHLGEDRREVTLGA